jgi:MerR family transcriptional regulator, redox-sensitive transcriptional activator SoxR
VPAALLSIGEVSAQAGLRTSAIRYYERIGLVPEPQRESGRRRYEPDVLRRLAVIELAKRGGFSLDEIHGLLAGFGNDCSPPERWRRMAERKLEELDAAIERIEGMRALLRRGIECGCLRAEDCDLLREQLAASR